MKLNIEQSSDVSEVEITIKCNDIDKDLEQIIEKIRQYGFTIQGKNNEGIELLKPNEIYYFESVDDKTYIYCEREVFNCEYKLYMLEKMPSLNSFCRISKSCILNLNRLKSFRNCFNSRIEAILVNGEKLIVNRNYIKLLKEKLDEMRCEL